MAFLMTCLAVFVIFLQPVYLFPMLARFQPNRNIEIVALLLFVFFGRKGRFLSDKTNIIFLLFAVSQIISSFFIWPGYALSISALWLEIGIMYYLIVMSVNTYRRLVVIIGSILAGAGYLVYFSIANFVVNYSPGVRAGGFGWYENGNDLAALLVSLIPVSFILFRCKNILLKILSALFACVCSFNILFTGSRNGLLGLIVVFALSMPLLKINKALKTLLIIIFVFSLIPLGIHNIRNRKDFAEHSLLGDDSSENRKILWRAALRAVADHPFVGVGIGEFRSVSEVYGGIRGLEPHNSFLQPFVDTGIISGVLFCMFVILPLWEIRAFLKKLNSSSLKDYRQVYAYKMLCISLTGFLVCAFFSNRYHLFILYAIVALIVAVRRHMIRKEVFCVESAN